MNILDLVLILVIAVIAIFSAKKGFLLTLLNIATYIVAGILSKIFASPVSSFIYDSFFSSTIISKLYEIMPSGSVQGELNTIVSNVIASLPEYVQSLASNFGIADIVSSGTDAATASLTVEMLEATYIAPIVIKVLTIVVSVLLFVLFALLLRVVSSFINKVLTKKKHKLIRGTNMFLGAAFGVVKGTAISAIAAAVLNIAAPLVNNGSLSVFVNESAICNIVAEILK